VALALESGVEGVAIGGALEWAVGGGLVWRNGAAWRAFCPGRERMYTRPAWAVSSAGCDSGGEQAAWLHQAATLLAASRAAALGSR